MSNNNNNSDSSSNRSNDGIGSPIDLENEFNVNTFNKDFDAYIANSKSEMKLKEEEKLSLMTSHSYQDNNHIRNVRLGDIPYNISLSWAGFIADFFMGKPREGLIKNNRLFYIALSMFVIALFMYFISTFFG